MINNSEPYDSLSSKLGPHLQTIVEKALRDNNELINDLDEIMKLRSWYDEAKKNPDEIPSILSNVILEQILKQVTIYLGHSISTKISFHDDSFIINEIEINFSVKPYANFTKKINHAKTSEIKVIFEFRITGVIKNISIKKELNGKVATIAEFLCTISMSLIGIETTLIVVPDANFFRSIEICRNKIFKATNLNLVIPSKNSGSPFGLG